MHLITFILLVFLSFCIAYLLGMAAHGTIGNLLIFAVVIVGANYLLTRRLCFTLAATGLILGVLGPVVVWTYGSMFIKTDPIKILSITSP